MPRPRSPVDAAIDAALAAPDAALLRAVERDGAAAYAELLADALRAVSADISRARRTWSIEHVPDAVRSAAGAPCLSRHDPSARRPGRPADVSCPPGHAAPGRQRSCPAGHDPSPSPRDVELLGTLYAAHAGYRIVRLEARAVRLRLPLARELWLPLAELLAVPEDMRHRWLHRAGVPRADARRLAADLRGAGDEDAALAALARRRAGPPVVRGPGSLVLQPCPERRRAGAHYTPRPLAEAVVRAALRPVLAAMDPRPDPAALLRLRICDPAIGSGVFLLAAIRQLADALLAAWAREGDPRTQADARRLVARTCIFGVDADPFAVELARRSCALLVDDDSPQAMSDALRHGDTLLGVDLEQLHAFHWQPAPRHPVLAAATERDPILARRVGDLLVGAFLSHETSREREHERRRRLAAILTWLAAGPEPPDLRRPPLDRPTFHWPLELPGPFDVVLGNPPFLGGGQISGAFGPAYAAWLQAIHPGAHGNADLCAHFLRRADRLLAPSGTIGFVATNTIGQGDTRATGLRPLLAGGYLLYEATRDLPWPEAAAVTVSIVHLARGAAASAVGEHLLHEPSDVSPRRHATRAVAAISSRLRAGPERPDPRPLAENRGIAFAGSKIYGQGFLLDPAERAALVARDPRNAERIAPYLGGEDISNATGPTRFVIDLGRLSLAEAEAYPDLLALVRARVGPERARNGRALRRTYWWRFGETAPGLYRALRGLPRCIVNSQVCKRLIFDFAPTDYVYSHTTYVHASPSAGLFAALQSRVHEVWARHLASSMKTDLRYSIADCFETFPFPHPDPRDSTPDLAAVGERLHRARAELLRARPQTLTHLYDALTAPQTDPALVALQALHVALDRAVLDAYGWTDLPVPPYAAPRDAGERAALAAFADELLIRLLGLNATRSGAAS